MRDEPRPDQKDQQARAIAAALGAGWTVAALTEGERDNLKYAGRTLQHRDPAATDPNAIRRAGYAIGLSWNTYGREGRMVIGGRWPATQAGEPKIGTREGNYQQRQERNWTTEITVALEKPAAAIAKDIQRRLLPDYLEAYELGCAACERTEAQQADTGRTLAILLAASGARASQRSREEPGGYPADSHLYSFTVSGKSVSFSAFSCPIEVALQIIEAAKKPAVCHRCEVAISRTQAGLSRARAEGAEALCADCVSAALTFQQHREDDPHCSCNDCLGEMGQAEAGR